MYQVFTGGSQEDVASLQYTAGVEAQVLEGKQDCQSLKFYGFTALERRTRPAMFLC